MDGIVNPINPIHSSTHPSPNNTDAGEPPGSPASVLLSDRPLFLSRGSITSHAWTVAGRGLRHGRLLERRVAFCGGGRRILLAAGRARVRRRRSIRCRSPGGGSRRRSSPGGRRHRRPAAVPSFLPASGHAGQQDAQGDQRYRNSEPCHGQFLSTEISGLIRRIRCLSSLHAIRLRFC